MSQEKKGLAAHLVAILVTEACAALFDDVLFPLAMAHFGATNGGLGMGALAFITNYLLVLWYRRTDSDWYGFEEARKIEAKEKVQKSFLARFIRGRMPTFVLLSIKDPFLGFAFFNGRENTKTTLSLRDWTVFITANVIGIGFWILLLTFVSEAAGGWVLNVIGAIGVLIVIRKLYQGRATTK